MNTLSQTPKNPVQFEMCDSFNKQFEAAQDLKAGQVVSLNSGGTVERTASAEDVPVGIVIKSALSGNKATVSTNFRAVTLGVLDADLAPGTLVQTSDNNDNYTIYSTAQTGIFAIGMVLATDGILEGQVGEIGLFYTPIFIPAP